MSLTRGSNSLDPGRRFAEAQFRRWFGRYFLAAFAVFVVGGAATQGRLIEAFALIVPHGVIELGAFFLVGGLTFRVTHRLVNYLRGVDETAITRQELFEVAVLFGVAAVAIVVAAWIEANLTLAIAEALFGPL